jgi:5-methylcytosine-specific restriction enzyme A
LNYTTNVMDITKSKHRPWQQKPSALQPITQRTRDPFYHSGRWKKESYLFRQENPLCAQCQREGFTEPSQVTDHIVPKDICADPWDKSNWEPLCKKHHSRKGSKDRKYFKK